MELLVLVLLIQKYKYRSYNERKYKQWNKDKILKRKKTMSSMLVHWIKFQRFLECELLISYST